MLPIGIPQKPGRIRSDPGATLKSIRALVLGGHRLHLDKLNREEMAAAGALIAEGVAEIGSSACRPILKARLD